MRIRPIRASDLTALEHFAACAGSGLTSLPADHKRLLEKIEVSVASFAGELGIDQAHYTFVLENDDGVAIGTSTLAASVGMREPWYNFRIGTAVHASPELDLYQSHRTLFLCNDLTGGTELCSLFLLPECRHTGNGPLLSKSRFLFLADFPDLFQPKVIAEMRGLIDERGKSPFWEGLGRHFFHMEFQQADLLVGKGQKAFIAEMLPRHTMYVDLLPADAQATIGKVHAETEPALRLLEEEGFSQHGYIDIFDGGPAVECERASIRSVRESKIYQAVAADAVAIDAPRYLISNGKLEAFRVCLSAAQVEDDRILLTADTLKQLEIESGAPVRAVVLRTSKRP